MPYAEHTTVSVEKSRLEIERICQRYGCSSFASAADYEKGLARVEFKCHNRRVRFELSLPKSGDFRAASKWEQKCRARWRALVLVLKGKLESVTTGIATFEEEFLPYIVMPNDLTVGAIMIPLIEGAYKSGKMPAQLMLTDGGPK